MGALLSVPFLVFLCIPVSIVCVLVNVSASQCWLYSSLDAVVQGRNGLEVEWSRMSWLI